MICPKCQVALSRHDNWCSQCGTYYNNAPAAPAQAAAPPPPPVYGTPHIHTEPSRGGGRFAIGGVSIGTIALVLRLVSLAYHASETNSEQAARDAADNAPQQTASAPAETMPSQADMNRQLQANLDAQMASQRAAVQAAQQQNQAIRQDMAARSASMRAMNAPNFSPMGPQGGGQFGRP